MVICSYNALIRSQIIIEQKGEGFCPITESTNHLVHAYHPSQQRPCTLNKLQIQTLMSSVGLNKRALKVWVKGGSVIKCRKFTRFGVILIVFWPQHFLSVLKVRKVHILCFHKTVMLINCVKWTTCVLFW